jgi:hypothetical protein
MKIPREEKERREYFRRIGRKGGKIGGKRSLETMTQAARTARAYQGGKQRRKVDRARLLALRKAGLTGREIARELGVSEASVWGIWRRRSDEVAVSKADSGATGRAFEPEQERCGACRSAGGARMWGGRCAGGGM